MLRKTLASPFLYRYIVLLHAAIRALKNGQSKIQKDWVLRQQSDICMLHLFESFMEAAPQILLQLYVMVVLKRALFWSSKYLESIVTIFLFFYFILCTIKLRS